MAMDPSNQSKRNLERVTLGLQASSFLVHVFCCGLPLIVSFAAFGGLAGITILPFGFESWFHKHELLIFFLALVMVAVSAGLQMMGHQHAKSTHHDHHDCSNHGHAHPKNEADVATCDHEDDCEQRASAGRWFLLASIALLALNAFMTFGFDHGH